MTVDMTAANNLPPRADELFRIFARFEFALKMSGYAKMGNGKVDILWGNFSDSAYLGAAFFNEIHAAEICPLLLNDPPKADRIEQGGYGFEDQASPPTSVASLFKMVRRVRNNLFHGGKYFDQDSERSRLLIEEAIAVLLLACERHPDVQFIFEGRA
jgi:hypothetical protein